MAKSPKAEVEISAESRGLGPRLREAKQKFTAFGGELKKEVFGKDLVGKSFFSGAGAHMVGSLGAGAVQSVVGATTDFLTEQGKGVLDFNDQLERLKITAGASNETMSAFAASVRKSSSDVGIDASKILEGAASYVALTGDMQGAIGAQEQWARVAQATNSEVKDIAGTAAALKQQMNIKPEQMEEAFSALAGQGKAGAIELKDLASQLAAIAPQWAQFAGGTGIQGIKELGATLQVVKRGFGGDAGETITGLQALLTSYVKNAKGLEKHGIKIFDKDPATGVKHLRNVLAITKDLSESKLAKDPMKLEKTLGRVEAYRALLQASNTTGIQEMIGAGNDPRLIARDLGEYSESSAAQSKRAWQEAKNEIADAFTPERIAIFTTALSGAIRVATGLSVALLKGVGAIQTMSEGFANVLGYKTEEDKAKEGQFETRSERVAKLEPGSGDWTGRGLLAKTQVALAAEDIGIAHTALAVRNGQQASFSHPWIGGGPDIMTTPAQGVSREEVNRMAIQAVGEAAAGTTTMPGANLNILVDAIDRLNKTMTETDAGRGSRLNGTPAPQAKTIPIQIDSTQIVGTIQRSPAHAARPPSGS